MKSPHIKKLLIFFLASAFLIVSAPAPSSASNEGLDIRILNAKRIFSEFNSKGAGIPKDILRRSNAIIIFPDMAKAGFLFAGRFGIGVALSRDPSTGQWSPPAFIRISGGGFGFQAGVQFTELILVGRDNFRLESLGRGGPTLSGDASASIGPWGVHSELGTGWELNSAMHWFSRNKGLFAALATDGTMLSWDDQANKIYYGEGAGAQDILFKKSVQPTANGQMLIDELVRYEEKEKPSEPKVKAWGKTSGKKMFVAPWLKKRVDTTTVERGE
jgi:lipid-binding SYLF domain-containing protein